MDSKNQRKMRSPGSLRVVGVAFRLAEAYFGWCLIRVNIFASCCTMMISEGWSKKEAALRNDKIV